MTDCVSRIAPLRRTEIPSQEVLRSVLRYAPDTGLFFWLPRGDAKFDAQYAGKEALTAAANGYRGGVILQSLRLRAHRVAFKYTYGRDPIGQIDHINGNRSDNRIVNLREATPTQQRCNAARPVSNTSGTIGVSFRREKRKWRAFIGAEGKSKHIGYFGTYDEALKARQKAERELGFHPNHGRELCY